MTSDAECTEELPRRHDVALVHHMSMFHSKLAVFPSVFIDKLQVGGSDFLNWAQDVSSYSLHLSSVSVLFVSESDVDHFP